MSATFNPRKPVKAYWDDEYSPHLGMSGACHQVSNDPLEADPVKQLHEVVEEVTRKPVARRTNKLGFY